MAIHNSAPQDSIKITKSNFFKKLCLTVGMIISIICIFIFVAFIGNSVYSYDEDTFVRNSPSKLYINRVFTHEVHLVLGFLILVQ